MRNYNAGIRVLIVMGLAALISPMVFAQSAQEYFNRGLDDLSQNYYDQAVTDFTRSIKINPNYAQAYNNRALAYDNLGNFPQAISDYTKAIELNPNGAVAYCNRALVYFVQKDYEKAWQDVHKAENLGYKVKPSFLDELKKASGRER